MNHIDSHINKLAGQLIRVIQAKAKDLDGVDLSYEDATKVALQVIKDVKK